MATQAEGKKQKARQRGEYGKRCENCGQIGRDQPTFARMYYEPVNGEYKRLCSNCWRIKESGKQKERYIQPNYDGTRCWCMNDHNSASGRCHHTTAKNQDYCGDCINECGMKDTGFENLVAGHSSAMITIEKDGHKYVAQIWDNGIFKIEDPALKFEMTGNLVEMLDQA